MRSSALLLVAGLLIATLLASLTFGALGDAVIAVRKTVNKPEAQLGDALRYTVYFNNTGVALAQRVWINDTFPVGVTYGADNAASVGGTRTGNYNWTFANVAIGNHAFTIDVTVNNQAVPDTYLVNLVALNYTNSLGVKQAPSTATASTLFGMKTKTLHLHDDFSFNAANALDPMSTTPPSTFRNCNVTANCDWDANGFPGITLRNAALNFSDPSTYHEWYQWPPMAWYFHLRGPGEVALWVDNPGLAGSRTINVLLVDWNGVNATVITTITASRSLDGVAGFQKIILGMPSVDYWMAPWHELLLILNVDASSSTRLYFAYESTGYDSTWTMRTGTYVKVLGTDTQEVAGNSTVTLFTHGEQVKILGAAIDPLGSFDIAGTPGNSLQAWVNITNPASTLIISYAPVLLLLEGPILPGLPNGYKVYEYVFSPGATPMQGVYSFAFFAQESNGIIVSRNGTFEIRYPVMAFAKTIDDTTPSINQLFTYTLYFNNSGTSNARILYVNDTLPLASATYVSDTATAANGTMVGLNSYHWIFTNVTPGTHNFAITMRMRLDAQPPGNLPNSVRFNFTDTKYRWEPEVVVQRNATISGPWFALRVFSTNALPRAGEIFGILTYFNNTGNEAARFVWLNYTISPNTVYMGDTASTAGANFTRTVSGNSILLRFDNVIPGTHALRLNLTFSDGQPGGASGDVTVSFQYQTLNGAQPASQLWFIPITLHEPKMNLTLTLSQTTGDPGDVIALTLAYDNRPSGASAAVNTLLNITLPADLVFVNASLGGTYNAASRSISWSYASIASGSTGQVRANVTVRVGAADALMEPVLAKATFLDDAGSSRPAKYAFGNITTRAPVFSLQATADQTVAEYQDTVVYRVYFNQTGTGQARWAYVNATLGPDTKLVTVTGPGAITLDLTTNSFHILLSNAGPASYVAQVTVRIATAFNSGGIVGNTFTLEYADDNGNPRPRVVAAPPGITLHAPHLELSFATDKTTAAPGDVVRYTITVRNTGTATARDYWVNVTLAQYLDYLSDSSPVTYRRAGSDYSWKLSNLGPGGQTSFYVDLQVNGSTPADRVLSEFFTVDYTDGRGLTVNETKSAGTTLKVTALPARGILEFSWYYLIPLLAAVGAGAAVALHRRKPKVDIEEIFVAYRDGTLLAHRSKTLTPDKDEDVLTAMFTAVQQFISDSFDLGENKDVKGLNIGDYTVEIQRGQYIYIAAVFRGPSSPALRAKLQALVSDVETEFKDALVAWNGNMDSVRGIKDRVRGLLKGAR